MGIIASAFTEVRDINRILSALRSGKWLYDENERQLLVEQVKNYEEPLTKGIMGIGHSADTFLELAALGGIGADWLLDKYNDDALCNQVIGATSKNQIMGEIAGYTRSAAGILLIELSRLTNTRDNIPHILDAAKNLPYTEETNFIKWFFTRLWIFIDDERVVDFLIRTLAEPYQVNTIHYNDPWVAPKLDPSDGILAMIGEEIACHPPDTPLAVPGPGYYARELLLLHGEERGIAALVENGVSPELILSAKDLLTGHTKPKKMFENVNTSGGQFSLLSKYLIQKLEIEKNGLRFLDIISALGILVDQETVNNRVIPMLFDLLAAQRQGFLDESVPRTEKALQLLESFWTTAPFLSALEHRDCRVRLLAVKSLVKIGDSSTITAINRLLNDDDRKVQKAAKKADRIL